MPHLDCLFTQSQRALNICRLPDGQFQASLEVSMGTFRISIEPTAEAAVRGLIVVPRLPVP